MASFKSHPRANGVCLATLILGLCVTARPVEFAGGTGEPNDPYRIATAGQLIGIGSDPNLLDKHFALVADIDLDPNLPGGRTFDQAIIAYPTDPYDPNSGTFTGHFDGRGHSMSGLRTVSAGAFTGLFGRVGYSGIIENIRLKNIGIVTSTELYNAGTLVGCNLGLVVRCESEGSLSAYYDVGGLIGDNEGTVQACCFAGSVKGGYTVGGLVGKNSGVIADCYCTGSVAGSFNVGGLLGLHSGTLVRGYATGPVTGDDKLPGGLVGDGPGVVVDSYSLPAGDGGEPNNDYGEELPLSLMRQRASFAGWDFFGDPNNGHRDTWFMPDGDSPVLSWQTDRTGLVWLPGLEGTPVEQATAVLTQAGLAPGKTTYDWDPEIPVEGVVAVNPCEPVALGTVVDLVVSAGPYDWQTNPGDGSRLKPHRIETAGQLVCLGHRPDLMTKCFVLAGDVDLTGRTYGDALIAPDTDKETYQFQGTAFDGCMDGGGHRVIGLTIISNSEYTGLFGLIGQEGVVRDLSLVDPYVIGNVFTASGGRTPTRRRCGTGALAGESDGLVSYCGSTDGQTVGLQEVGGLIGDNQGTVEGCYAGGSATGYQKVGGLVGNCQGTITDSYARTRVAGSGSSGWLVGEVSYSLIRSCYAASVTTRSSSAFTVWELLGSSLTSIVVDSYFLVSARGEGLTSDKGNGLTDAQMRQRSSFAAWDFYGTDADGRQDRWFMPEGSYPVLIWQTQVTGWQNPPHLEGLGLDEAKSLLKSLGMTVGSIQEDYDATAPAGQIMTATPGPNGGSMDLLVSKGPYDWSTNPGNGTEANPYQIRTAGQLTSISDHPQLMSRDWVIAADIDLTGRILTKPPFSAGGTPFTGRLDGRCHRITGLTIMAEQWPYGSGVGLIGRMGPAGYVRDLALERVSIAVGSSASYVGALAGYCEGRVFGCCATDVSISSAGAVAGGLVGQLTRGAVNASYTSGMLTAGRSPGAGGLLGRNDYGVVSECYTTVIWSWTSSSGSSTSGSQIYAGLIGSSSGTVLSSYFLIPAYERTLTNTPGVGLSDPQMRRQGSFVGMDFLGDDSDGILDLWTMPGEGYPILTWQILREGFVIVPTVTGMTLKAARAAIEAAGLEVGIVTQDFNPDYPSGVVAWRSGGAWTTPGTVIDLYVSRGLYDWSTNEGDGTAARPYVIRTGGQLVCLGARPELYGASFRLACDIDMAAWKQDRAVIAREMDKKEDGFESPLFEGTFDGRRYVIRNLTLRAPDGTGSLGLFGRLGTGARVSGVRLVDVSVYAGNTVTNVGGLAGSSDGVVLDCHVNSSFSAGERLQDLGGLVGTNRGAVIGSTASITATVASISFNGEKAAGNVGGLIGINYGTVACCIANSKITTAAGTASIGGLVGQNSHGVVVNCSAAGTITGGWASGPLGGLVGYNYLGSVVNCFSTSLLGAGNHSSVGRLIGSGAIGVSGCYFLDPNNGGKWDNKVGTVLSDSQMRQQASFVGWDFLGQSHDGTSEVWMMPPDGGYPVLSILQGYQPVALSGSGTADDPFLIETVEQLGAVAYRPGACYRLVADIDASGITWSSAVIPGLMVSLDGAGHRVTHLSVNSGGHAGLVGLVHASARITNLAVEDAAIAGQAFSHSIGALAGMNQGLIHACHATGAVVGTEAMGGLIGVNTATVSNSWADCAVSSPTPTGSRLGGLVGDNSGGTIRACYAASPVEGTGWAVGGLVGAASAGEIESGLSPAVTVSAGSWASIPAGRWCDVSLRVKSRATPGAEA